MSETPQSRAVRSYRKRLEKRGMARFEVLGLEGDRELIRKLARRLAEGDKDARRIRAALSGSLKDKSPALGGIFAALRRSPLAGAELEIKRERTSGRNVSL